MKVCHFTSVHSPLDVRIFLKECVTLAEAGYETNLVVTGYKNTITQGVKIYSVEKSPGRLKRMLATAREVYKVAKNLDADIYHFHDPELLPYALLLRLSGKIVIYDVHEDLPRDILSKHWIPRFLRKIISFLVEKLENAIAKKCIIVGATPTITKRFDEIGCKSVNINNYPIMSELFSTTNEWNNKSKQVCYVGGINKVRGIDQMIRASYKTNTQLVLAGTFTNIEYKNILQEQVEWQNVKELGQIDREGIKELYKQSIAGLVVLQPIVTFVDSLPIKLFEYMAAGIPVICSNFPLWKTIVEENNCGICVDPSDEDAIAAAINWIVNNPEGAAIMGKNGRLAVENKYNWEIESNKLLNLYKELENENLDI
ncbi:glycosyltransferase family 4 protein [Paenibacillus silviterrae]|uniref:glycosyltransferase family 4 protein n=1 Tax=Paenibacillus silviterrae TaxID=3242194 RepID=UPI002543507C|nr:glycosyltransferase family 4 protein [Paenibacillus chinjuensis]